MKKIELRSDCPISYALDFFGDKWTLLIIRDLMFEGKKFYKDFLNSKEGIATNVLSNRLKKLQQNGIIESRVYEKLRTQKVYSLTQKGKDLIPVLVEIMVWSAQYGGDCNLALTDEFVYKMKHHRELVIQSVLSNVE